MKELFKVIVAGGRDFDNYELLKEKMDIMLSNIKNKRSIIIVSGTAKGADTLGERYANENGFPIAKFPAQWGTYGKSAGYKRNTEMAVYADALVAFWDGKSKGTEHMINIATEKGLKIRVINY